VMTVLLCARVLESSHSESSIPGVDLGSPSLAEPKEIEF